MSPRNPQLVSALRGAIIVQLVTLLPVLLMEGVDDLLYLVAGCMAIFWLTASVLIWKQPTAPSRARMIFLRYGYVILLAVATPAWLSVLKPWLEGTATATVMIEPSPAGNARPPPAAAIPNTPPATARILTDRDACDEFFAKLLGQQSLNEFQKAAGLPRTKALNPETEAALLKQAGYTMLEEKDAPLKLKLAYDAPTRELAVRLANAGPQPLRLANNRLAIDSDRASFALETIIRLADAKPGEPIDVAGASIATRQINQMPADFGDSPVIPTGTTLTCKLKLSLTKTSPIAIDINSAFVVLPDQKKVFRIPAAYWP